jgi:hypothetical protein
MEGVHIVKENVNLTPPPREEEKKFPVSNQYLRSKAKQTVIEVIVRALRKPTGG